MTATSGRLKRRDRVAMATWPRDADARIGMRLQLDWDRIVLAHPNIAPVAMVGFALGQALAANPVANRRVALWKVRPHRTVRLSFAVHASNDLRIAVVDRADELSPTEFQRALRASAREARSRTGPLARATRLVEAVPVVVSRPALRCFSALTSGLGIGVMGITGTPFGAALISSVARFGLPAVDVPFVSFTRCALVCSVGAVAPGVVVRDGAPAVANLLGVNVSYDHRICDASQLASLLLSFETALYHDPVFGPPQPVRDRYRSGGDLPRSPKVGRDEHF